jgi:hypothetical protein
MQAKGSVFSGGFVTAAMRWSKFLFQPGARFFGMIVKGTESASIGDFPGFIDDVNALGPSSVGEVCRFAHVIHANGQREVEALDKIVGDGHALSERLRLRIANAFVHIAFHLPFILGMRFANINGQEIRLSFVIVIDIDKVAYLAAEGRSGIAAEDQDKRALADTVAEMKLGLAIEAHQRYVWSAVADVEIAAMPLRKSIAQEAVHIAGAAHEMAEHAVTDGKDGEQYQLCPLQLV